METTILDSIISVTISCVALIISIAALVYTAKTYLLKSGVNIRGTYSTHSSISCEDKYIGSVTLENLKDRAVVIFKIYLKLGHNYFIEVDDFENAPLILKPFQVFKKEYDPIDLYSVSSRRIRLNDLLDNNSVKRQLVLSTSDGKYPVRESINHWDPILTFFQNYMTAVIRPMRSTFKGKAYGSDAKFIVDFKMENGKEEIVPIYPRDYEIKKFKQFNLTKESLESRESLEEYLYEKASEGKLNCLDIVVHELESWRNEVYEMENKKVITASNQSWFMYYIVGRMYTIFSDYRLKKKNKALRKKRANNQNKPTE
jgi:hypothetical protein